MGPMMTTERSGAMEGGREGGREMGPLMTRERREGEIHDDGTRDDEREERDRKMGPVMTRERRETGRWDP